MPKHIPSVRCRRGKLPRGRRIEGRSLNNDIAVLHAIAGLHARSGGTSRVVIDITDTLAQQQNLSIALLAQSHPCEESLPSVSMEVKRFVAVSQSSLALALGLPFRKVLQSIIKTKPPALLHSHGLWLPLNHWASSLGCQNGIPVIVQPHGMLESWALNHKARKKKLVMALFQRRDLESASVFIATAAMEFESIRALGLRQPVAVIPNGVLFGASCVADAHATVVRTDNTERVALFLSRVHPIKGVLNLLQAWAQVAPKGWRLKIAGPNEGGHLAEVMAMARELGIAQVVEYLGSVDGQIKAQTYLAADLFVLPTFSENFGVVVAEALAHGLPVITTRGAPWADLEIFDCGWWVDIGVDPLVHALRDAMALSDEERRAMGARGRDYVKRFDWDAIAKQTLEVYRWLLGQGPLPDFVRLS